FMASGAFEDRGVTDYLDRWARLFREEGGLTLGEAVERARPWTLWRKARDFRYPIRDDAS
ncbi:MAG TPA: hypothetical protein VK465_11145, partial [Fibrobacteria bacterium]|nr:hypothetical protein [Fibrobacteria bacterium]